MNVDVLLSAVLKGKIWIERFTRTGYEAAFRDYKVQFGPVYMEEVQNAGEEGLPALAAALLDGMEAAWARERPWNRTVVRLSTKQMLVQYLSPLLLSLEEQMPGCQALAEYLRDAWAVRWPKEAYQLALWKDLQRGFRRTILGIPVPDGFGGTESRE